jgi:hypothetical protein
MSAWEHHSVAVEEHTAPYAVAGGGTVAEVRVDLPQPVLDALQRRSELTGESIGRVAARALADALQVGQSTLFQLSTATALVAGCRGRRDHRR